MHARQATRIQLCGLTVVDLAGVRVGDLAGRQGRLLFAFLALNRFRPVTRGELSALLWPDSPPPAAEASLSGVLSRLRRTLGDGVIAGRSELRLVLPRPCWIDVEAAFDELHRAQSAVASGDWPRAWTSGRIALHISRRELLPGYEGEWLEERRRSLAAVHLGALECVGEASLELGGAELAAAERSGRSLIDLDPYRESGHRLLMRAQAALGNRAAALATFEQLRVLLRDQLGTTPSPATQALHKQFLH